VTLDSLMLGLYPWLITIGSVTGGGISYSCCSYWEVVMNLGAWTNVILLLWCSEVAKSTARVGAWLRYTTAIGSVSIGGLAFSDALELDS
jgi:hypothetical protein